MLALGAIAWALSDSAKVGAIVCPALHHRARGSAGSRGRCTFACCASCSIARACICLHSLRHGLANLYRPGNQSAAVLAALGTGVMLILAVYLMQRGLLRDLRETASPSLPNVFLIDVRSDEVAGVKQFFAHQPGVSQQLSLIPVVMGRFISINGQPVEQMKDQHYPRRMLESAELTWADTPPDGDKVTAGYVVDQRQRNPTRRRRWRGQAPAPRRGLRRGIETGGTTRTLTVAAIYRSDGQHLGARVSFVLPSGLIADQPSTWYGGAHIDPKQVAAHGARLLSGLSHHHHHQCC